MNTTIYWDRVSGNAIEGDQQGYLPGWVVVRGLDGYRPVGVIGRRLQSDVSAATARALPEPRRVADSTRAALVTTRLIMDGGLPLVALADVPGLDHGIVEAMSPYLKSLRGIVDEPAARLSRVPELKWLPASGRVTRRTIARLASHSEDWERVRLNGVHARKVLLEKPAEDYDLHENRIFVDAIYLLERAVLAKHEVVKAASDANAEARRLELLTHFARERVSFELGGLGDLEGMRERLDDEERRLRRLLRLIATIKQGEPVKTLGWRRFTEALQPTNLFVSDRRYFDVARMARALRGTKQASEKDVEVRLQMGLHSAFDSYVAAVARVAVDALNKAERHFDSPGIDASGVVTVSRQNKTVRVVPVPVSEGTVEQCREALVNTKAVEADGLVIAAIGRPASRRLLPGGHVSIVQLGPFALQSVEVMQAALRWHLEASDGLRYPRDMAVSYHLAILLQDLAEASGGRLHKGGRGLVIDSWALPLDTTRKKLLDGIQSKKENRRQQVLGWDQDQVDAALEVLEWTWRLRTCPVCATVQSGSREWMSDSSHVGHGLFNVRCAHRPCSARWGVFKCHEHRVPRILHASGKDPGGDQWAPEECPYCQASTERV